MVFSIYVERIIWFNTRIIGIDFNPSAKRWKEYGFEIFIGNQSDAILENFLNK